MLFKTLSKIAKRYLKLHSEERAKLGNAALPSNFRRRVFDLQMILKRIQLLISARTITL